MLGTQECSERKRNARANCCDFTPQPNGARGTTQVLLYCKPSSYYAVSPAIGANDERQRRLADRVARRMLRERAPSPHGDSASDEDPYAWGSPEPVLGHVPGYARRH